MPGHSILSRRGLLVGSAALGLVPGAPGPGLLPASAQTPAARPADGLREIPARPLPVPDTVSAALRPAVAAPPAAGWDEIPRDAAGWRALAQASGAHAGPVLEAIRTRLRIKVEQAVVGGVPVFVSTPDDMPEANRGRLLVHLHGGGYVLYPGEVGAGEGMMMAGHGRYRVVSVDYRMAPDHPFPAAVDDAVAVWKALLVDNRPDRMAIFGTSAGGGLTLATLLRAREEGLPMPAAVAPGSPWADLTRTGDSLFANALVDNALVSMDGWVGAAALLYAAGRDLRDPLVSPLYGDFAGFPPAILTSGTRDLLLSDTVRTHRKLRQAGVEAVLQVFEAQSHAQFLRPFTPETAEAFEEIARFFDRHLQR